jgi:hypothetical protein
MGAITEMGTTRSALILIRMYNTRYQEPRGQLSAPKGEKLDQYLALRARV